MINIGLNSDLYFENIRKNINLCLKANGHLIISGFTGSGKTYALKSIIYNLLSKGKDLIIIDYKGDDDFESLEDCKNFYRYNESLNGFIRFYKLFEMKRMNIIPKCSPLVLCFDEYNSFLGSLDNKDKNKVTQMMSDILNMGRSFNCHVIISVQRPDAEYFAKSRDNLVNRLLFGEANETVTKMLFESYTKELNETKERREKMKDTLPPYGLGFYASKNGFEPIIVLPYDEHSLSQGLTYMMHMSNENIEYLEQQETDVEDKSVLGSSRLEWGK